MSRVHRGTVSGERDGLIRPFTRQTRDPLVQAEGLLQPPGMECLGFLQAYSALRETLRAFNEVQSSGAGPHRAVVLRSLGGDLFFLTLKHKHGVKSYEIVQRLLGYIYASRPLSIVDLTFGVGRFYRLSRSMIGKIVAVDIERYRWEIEPTVFYQMDCRVFVDKVLNGEIELGDVDIVVVDPPWSHEKRGARPKRTGISRQPYHLKGVDSKSIIHAALRLSEAFNKPLLYRYREPLPCNHLVLAIAEVKMIYNKGQIYYGICS